MQSYDQLQRDYNELLNSHNSLKQNLKEDSTLFTVALFLSGHRDQLLSEACKIIESHGSLMAAVEYAEKHPMEFSE